MFRYLCLRPECFSSLRKLFFYIAMALTLLVFVGHLQAAASQSACEAACSKKHTACTNESYGDFKHQRQNCINTYRKLASNCSSYKTGSAGHRACKAHATKTGKTCFRVAFSNKSKSDDKCDRNVNECKEDCKSAGSTSSGSGGSRTFATVICPNGTRPNALGVCEAIIRLNPLRPGVGGCPPGQVPGPRDQCLPTITLKFTPVPGGFVIACPKGTKPSPIDGRCVPDLSGPAEEEGVGPIGRACPPGTAPAPDGDYCVPLAPVFGTEPILELFLGNAGDLMREAGSEVLGGIEQQDPSFLFVMDFEGTAEATAEALEGTWEPLE